MKFDREALVEKICAILPSLRPMLENKKARAAKDKQKRKAAMPTAGHNTKSEKPDLTEFYVKFPPKFQESGPYRLAELKTLARDGLITAETHIRTDHTSWMYAKNIQGLPISEEATSA